MRPRALVIASFGTFLALSPFAGAQQGKPAKPKTSQEARKKAPPAPAAPTGKDAKAPATAPPAATAPAAPAPPETAAKPSAADAVARMQRFYDATSDLHAHFDQELTAAIGGKKKASGEVWLKKPGRMRWEYQKPEKKLMVADGTTLWVYEPEDEQAFKQSLKTSSLPSSVTFLLGTGKLGDEFVISDDKPEGGAGEPGDIVLKLVPKQPTAQYRYLYFVVDPKSYMVKETLVYDQQGGVNHMRFHEVETNKGLSNAKFEFSPPSGTKIIRP